MTKATEARQQAELNTRHWDALKKTDPSQTKSFSRAGGFKGTALKPIWIVQQLTKHFGPVGVGWGMDDPQFQVVQGDNREVLVYCTVRCWHTKPDNSFYGVGGDKVVTYIKANEQYKRPERWESDDEAFKKAFTDAVNNAFKFVGVGADIHMGQFDDSKYVRELTQEFAPKLPEEVQVAEFVDAIALAQTLDDLKALLDKYKPSIDTVAAAKPAITLQAQQVYAARRKAIQDAEKQLEPAE